LILGLGQFPQGSGVTAALLFARLGAKVTVTDLKTRKELLANVKQLSPFKNVKFVLGKHDLEDVKKAEIVVANQRVRQSSREILLARKLRIPVVTEMSLFLDRCPCQVIGVTGTRGKSTTASLIAHILKASGRRTWLGGNILVSPLTFLSKMKKSDVCVLELSSFQTESSAGVRVPHIAVVTNLMRDHLNAYGSMEEYAEAKAQIFRHQTARDVVILNADDAYGRAWSKEAPGEVLRFGTSKDADASLIAGKIVLRQGRRRISVLSVSRIPLLGSHNVSNALAAALACRTAGVSITNIRRGIASFRPLPNRLEPIRTVRGVLYVNDTCATTPDGTIAAIEALVDRKSHHHLWVIVGGADKDLIYDQFARVAATYHPHIHVILMPGDASKKIRESLKRTRVHIHDADDMKEAVYIASKHAMRGDAAVLSPGAASFNQFANEFERGEMFKKCIKALKRESLSSIK
jgi:UDP-N-acetylmuramoylalanine--D-glutamate ligase